MENKELSLLLYLARAGAWTFPTLALLKETVLES